MKKTLLSGLLLFAAAATFTSCAKDETSDPATTAQTTISATVEEPTRTMLDGEQVKWMANDKILLANAVNGKTAAYTLTADGGAGTTSGIFSGNDLGAGAKFALYPYSATATCASGKFSFEMPATQAYAAKTFGNGANPMIAQSDANGVLNFQNMCGVIKLTLKGTQKVGKIVVSTVTTDEKLSGSATVAFDADGLPVLTMNTEAATAVTLNCNNAQLDAATATPFYIVVPAATYAKGLQFEIYDETGAHINSLITSKELIVTRSQVAPLSEKTIATLHFPDANFRAALIAAPYNLILTTDGTDIDVKDVDNQAKFASTKEIVVSFKKISSLKGIEYFTNLEKLDCAENKVTSLDVSQNTKLTYLYCDHNQLTSLDVSQNTALTELDCNHTPLTSLDVSKHTALTILDCQHSRLMSLDVSNNTALTYLDCSYTPLKSLDLSKNTALTTFDCEDDWFTNLDVSQNTKLTTLNCTRNLLTSLDVSQNTALTELNCNDNQLKSLDVSQNTALIGLICFYNQLTSLDVSQNTAIDYLYCQHNQLTSLDVRNNTALSCLACSENLLSSLDLSKNTRLDNLNCDHNQLTSLDVILNWRLDHLRCQDNQLTSLDVSKNTRLKLLFCDSNQLTSLDVSQNTKLDALSCYMNQLTSLDIQPLTLLKDFQCGQQLAGGVVAPSYSELKLYMTQTQFNKNLGTGYHNDSVTRVVPVGK